MQIDCFIFQKTKIYDILVVILLENVGEMFALCNRMKYGWYKGDNKNYGHNMVKIVIIVRSTPLVFCYLRNNIEVFEETTGSIVESRVPKDSVEKPLRAGRGVHK